MLAPVAPVLQTIVPAAHPSAVSVTLSPEQTIGLLGRRTDGGVGLTTAMATGADASLTHSRTLQVAK